MVDITRLYAEGLRSLGINFETEEEMIEFIKIIEEEYELRVGNEISRKMSPRQLNEFDSLTDNEASEWLIKNCPDYSEINKRVKDEFADEILKYKNDIPGLI